MSLNMPSGSNKTRDFEHLENVLKVDPKSAIRLRAFHIYRSGQSTQPFPNSGQVFFTVSMGRIVTYVAHPDADRCCFSISTLLCASNPLQNFVPRLVFLSFFRSPPTPSTIIYESNRLFVISLRRRIDEQKQRRSRRRRRRLRAPTPTDSATPPLSL